MNEIRVHLTGRVPRGVIPILCGRDVDEVTEDPKQVTCQHCLLALRLREKRAS